MIRGQIFIAALATLGLLGTGCDFFDAFNPDGGRTLVNVFSTHHATPEDNGIVPDRGGDGETRVFDNDEGWTVHIGDGFVVTRGISLHSCDGEAMSVETYLGALAEDLSHQDLDRMTVGGAEVGPSSFCSMTVHYGPFDAGADEAPPETDPSDLDGLTLILAGWAQKGEDKIPFELRSNASLDVHLDLSVMASGGPVRVTGDEDFPVELTVLKTYDRLFDGIDFGTAEEADMVAQTLVLLEEETRVEITQ